MLISLGRWMTDLSRATPFTDVVGLGRSLLAAGTLITLLFNDPTTLFRPAQGMPPAPYCEGVTSLGLFCFMPVDLGRWLAVAVLVLVISGWRPRFTAIPHWFVAFSLQVSGTVVDGGDQVASALALLLIPLGLLDGRANHWHRVPESATPTSSHLWTNYAGWVVGFLIRVQVAVLYFHAGVAKFGVAEWRDGTAMYYWMRDPSFGVPGWLQPLTDPVVLHGFTVAAFSWSVVIGEVLLATGLFMPVRYRRYLLAAAVLFHLGIAVMMGLISFAFSMIAADLLFLHPLDRQLGFRAWGPRLARLRQVTAAGTRSGSGPARVGWVGVSRSASPEEAGLS